MKKLFGMSKSRLALLVLSVFAILLGVGDASAYHAQWATTVPGVDAGSVVTGGAATLETTAAGSPHLLMSDIDQKITKIRAMDTPVDQIARYATAIKSESMIYKYYSVGTADISTTLDTAVTQPTGASGGYATAASNRVTLAVANSDIFEITSTIRVKGVKGYKADGTTLSNSDLMLIVVAKADDGSPIVKAVNGIKKNNSTGTGLFCVPTIAQGTTLLSMGRAAAELDVQTAQFSVTPTDQEQYMQIFKMQVEESTFNKIAKKEVDWSFSDMEEAAVFQMRRGMEQTFWFGVKSITTDETTKKQYYTTGGIWDMAGGDIAYGASTSDLSISEAQFVDICKTVFTGGKGNKEKILFGGSDLIATLAKMTLSSSTGNPTNYLIEKPTEEVLWGLKFKKMTTIFGTLLVIHNEMFDQMESPKDGFILDYEYLAKAVHVEWERLEIDLKVSGQRNADAVVLSEASCVFLRYPKAHFRVQPRTV